MILEYEGVIEPPCCDVALARDRDGLRDQMPVHIALLLVEEASNALDAHVLEYRVKLGAICIRKVDNV